MPLSANEGGTRDDHGIVTGLRLRGALAVAAAVALTGALATAAWPAREYVHGDFFQYWAGAHALLEGADPYDLAWWVRFHAASGSRAVSVVPQPADGPAWTTAYPLWTLAAFVPLALLPFPLASAVWLVAQLAVVAAGTWALARACLAAAPRRDGLVLGGIALGFQPLWLLPGNGNITGFLFGALAGAVALREARPSWAGVLLGALALKPQSLAVAALAVLAAAGPRARRRMLLAGAALVAGLVLVSFALRPGWVDEWTAMVAALQRSAGSNATLWTLGRATGVPALSVAAPIALVAGLLAWAWQRRPPPAVLIAAAVPVSVAVAPHGWTYDQLHLLVSAAVVLGIVERAPWRILALALLVVGTALLPWCLYLVAVARHSEDWSALVPAAMFALVLGCDRAAGRTR